MFEVLNFHELNMWWMNNGKRMMFKMFGVLNFHELNMWWMNNGKCMMLDAKFIPK
jgi:hypothetical protein